MPVLFVGHGSPMNVLDKENPFNTHYFYDFGKIFVGLRRFCKSLSPDLSYIKLFFPATFAWK